MRSLLLRAPNWLGDAIMALPAFDALIDAFVEARPGAAVAVECKPGLFDLFRAHPRVDALVDASAPSGGPLPRRFSPQALRPTDADADKNGVARLGEILKARGGRFDAGVLFTNSFSSAWRFWRTGTRYRVGYARDGRRLLLNRAVACPTAVREQHVSAYYNNLAAEVLRLRPPPFLAEAGNGAGAGSGEGPEAPPSAIAVENNEASSTGRDPATDLPIPRFTLPEAARREARELLGRVGVAGRYAVLAPLSAYGAVKDWPGERYAELAARLAAAGLAVLLTGAPSQESECEDIRRMAVGAGYHQKTEAPDGSPRGGVHNVAGRTALSGFLGLLAEASLFVGGDSGGAHAAAALGARTTVIFTVTEPGNTRPLGRDVRVVGEGTGSSAPSRFNSASTASRMRESLSKITVERVWTAATRERPTV